MNNTRIFSLFFFILITDAFAQTFIPPGDVSGYWVSAGSPFYIEGEVTVPDGETLTIEPGVSVIFLGHYKFNIQGRLIAIGTQQDSISFTADSIEIGWHGIRFNYTPNTNDTSKLVYCSFRYGKANTGVSSSWDRCGGAILIGAFDKVLISDCLFEYNMTNGDISPTIGGAAIFIKSASPIITNSTFRNNTGTTECSILSLYNSIYNSDTNPVITNNKFLNNSGPHGPVTCCYNNAIISNNFISGNVTSRAGGGIFTVSTNAIVTNNIVINNQCFGGEGEGGGIKCWINDKAIFINNTIAYNSSTIGGGICCNQNSDPDFINNIIWGNTATNGNQINLLEATSDPNFFYSDIQGGKEGFGGSGAGNNYTGLYENNIDAEPLFVNALSDDFHLTDYSPCIGSGIDSIEVAGIWHYVPPFCFYGNPRPDPAGSMPDIGACENHLDSALVEVEQEFINPTEFILYQNFPNPFNPGTVISFQMAAGSLIALKVFDVLGNEITTLIDEYKPAGKYGIEFNAASLPSGVYFYQLLVSALQSKDGKAGGFIDTKKMLLLK
jgi:hypothetical protein